MENSQQHKQTVNSHKPRHFTKEEIDYLRKNFHYDPMEGTIMTRRMRKLKGSGKSDGYKQVRTSIGLIYYHRLAWILYTGNEPKQVIDHINRNKHDNRICNLRDVSQRENCLNRAWHPNKDTGFVGITLSNRLKDGSPCGFLTRYNNRKYYFRHLADALRFRIRHGMRV